MLRSFLGCFTVLLLASVVGCESGHVDSNDPYADDMDLGSSESFLTKCQNPNPSTPQANFCDDPLCPCTFGQGDCDTDAQCVSPYKCTGNGPYFGYPSGFKICAASTCNDRRKDGDETAVDCGGSCGTVNCPADACAGLPPNGTTGHCSSVCACAAGNGNCNASSCQPGLTCLAHGGVKWGLGDINICEGSFCRNGVKDGDETGADCGGSCAPCGGGTLFAVGKGGAGIEDGVVIVEDTTGAVVVAGTFTGTTNLGGSNLVSAGKSDIFVAKYSNTGAHVFSKRFGGTGADGDAGVALALDPSNNIILGGNIYGPVDFGGGARESVGAVSSAFLVRMNGSGTHVWSKAFGGPSGNRIRGLAADGNNIYVAGAFQTSINLGGSTFTAANSDPLFSDAFVAAFSKNSTHLWSRAFQSAEDDQAAAIAVDSTSALYVGGHFSKTVNFGTSLTSAGSIDGFALKLSSSTGATTWAKKFGGTADDRVNTIAVAANLNPAIGGFFRGTANLGGTNFISKGSTDAFAASLDTSTGANVWVHAFGGTSADFVTAVTAIKSTNDVAIGGYFQGTMDPGGGSMASAGSNDMYVIRYLPNGNQVWQRQFGGTGSDKVLGLSGSSTNIAASGVFSGSFSFGGKTLTSAGSTDMFAATLGL